MDCAEAKYWRSAALTMTERANLRRFISACTLASNSFGTRTVIWVLLAEVEERVAIISSFWLCAPNL